MEQFGADRAVNRLLSIRPNSVQHSVQQVNEHGDDTIRTNLTDIETADTIKFEREEKHKPSIVAIDESDADKNTSPPQDVSIEDQSSTKVCSSGSSDAENLTLAKNSELIYQMNLPPETKYRIEPSNADDFGEPSIARLTTISRMQNSESVDLPSERTATVWTTNNAIKNNVEIGNASLSLHPRMHNCVVTPTTIGNARKKYQFGVNAVIFDESVRPPPPPHSLCEVYGITYCPMNLRCKLVDDMGMATHGLLIPTNRPAKRLQRPPAWIYHRGRHQNRFTGHQRFNQGLH